MVSLELLQLSSDVAVQTVAMFYQMTYQNNTLTLFALKKETWLLLRVVSIQE